jgi:hypothetical protein
LYFDSRPRPPLAAAEIDYAVAVATVATVATVVADSGSLGIVVFPFLNLGYLVEYYILIHTFF